MHVTQVKILYHNNHCFVCKNCYMCPKLVKNKHILLYGDKKSAQSGFYIHVTNKANKYCKEKHVIPCTRHERSSSNELSI